MKKSEILLITILFSVAVHWGYSQDHKEEPSNSNKRNFDNVANIFEDLIRPYLRKFAEIQQSPSLDSATLKEAINAQEKIFKQKVQHLRQESNKVLVSSSKEVLTLDYWFGYFSFLYSVQFPGLDFQFFEQCRHRVREQKGKEPDSKKQNQTF